MRILVRWDDAAEAELISLYLGASDNAVVFTLDRDEFYQQADAGPWDVVLLATSLPDFDGAFEEFEKVRRVQPDCPVVGACRTEDTFRIARFMTNGMRTYAIRDVAGDFVFLLQATLESTVEAVRAEREQKISERLREEIESVRKLQESIIPQNLEAPTGYKVVARYESSQIHVLGGQPVIMAGGDYYDVFMLDDDHVVLLLGDASGHGMKACMSIMTMHTLIGMIRTEEYHDTAAFVEEVNRRLCGQRIISDEGGFITLLFAILNAKTNEIEWTSAGHPFPMLQDMQTGEISQLGTEDDGGLPLGIITEAEYERVTSPIPRGSRLLLYTDGLIEAFPEGGDEHVEFGIGGVEQSLKDSRSVPLFESLQRLFTDSSAYTAGAGRHDDTSVVLLEREGQD